MTPEQAEVDWTRAAEDLVRAEADYVRLEVDYKRAEAELDRAWSNYGLALIHVSLAQERRPWGRHGALQRAKTARPPAL